MSVGSMMINKIYYITVGLYNVITYACQPPAGKSTTVGDQRKIYDQ